MVKYINYYGIPCQCTIVKDGNIKTICFKIRYNPFKLGQSGYVYPHKDFIQMGFVFYEDYYFKNVNLKIDYETQV
jgi:hypothetical protein